MPTITAIDVNELPRFSAWPARLLGIEEWRPRQRTESYVAREYDRDKYGAMLSSWAGEAPEDLVLRQIGGPGTQLCVSRGNDLYLVAAEDALRESRALLLESLGPHIERARTIVELGSGYGVNLCQLHEQWPERVYIGGEFSENAVKLAAKCNPGCRVIPFNYYRPSDYDFIAGCESPVVVFTAHSIEQIPDAGCIVSNLLRVAPDVVVHLEPLYHSDDSQLLGLLRRRYAEVNDYNRNLLPLLDSFNPYVRREVFGVNPLNPTSVITWTPTC